MHLRYSMVFLLGSLSAAASSQEASRSQTEQLVPAIPYSPLTTLPNGRLVTIYVLGASSCIPSNRPELFEALRVASASLAARGAREGFSLKVVGVALDWSATEGLLYLSKLGPVDELVAGGSWMNSVGVAHIWRRPDGRAATPQVLVVETHVELLGRRIEVGPDVYRATLVGPDAIVAWAHSGTALAYKAAPNR